MLMRRMGKRNQDMPCIADTIAPPPVELSIKALYAFSFVAFACAALALSLGVSYITCTTPMPVSSFN
jgi:hypothetical protein